MGDRDRYNSNYIFMLTAESGPVWMPVANTNGNESYLIVEHFKTVHEYLEGKVSEEYLSQYSAFSIAGYTFETDPETLEQLAYAGQVDVQELYES